MNRRDFVQASAASAALATAGSSRLAAAPQRRPNLLYVFSDQHRAASLPGEPFNQAAAPHLDAFRHANFSMERCVSNYPLCTPYRGILMSGRWPYQIGLTHNNVALDPQETSLGRVFRDAGYHTGYAGKWHLQGRGTAFIPAGLDRQGFEYWHVEYWHLWERTNAYYRSWTYDPDTGARIQPEGWNCTITSDKAASLRTIYVRKAQASGHDAGIPSVKVSSDIEGMRRTIVARMNGSEPSKASVERTEAASMTANCAALLGFQLEDNVISHGSPQ